MEEQILWTVGFGLSLFLLGFLLSNLSNDYYLKLKAGPKYRTAMCVRGKFYYIIPEHEYVSTMVLTGGKDYATKTGPAGGGDLDDCGARTSSE
jgi:hypothetical protein